MPEGGTAEDKYAAKVARDYAKLIATKGWYEFGFMDALGGLWTQVPMTGPGFFRKWERRFALSAEYLDQGGVRDGDRCGDGGRIHARRADALRVAVGWSDSLAARGLGARALHVRREAARSRLHAARGSALRCVSRRAARALRPCGPRASRRDRLARGRDDQRDGATRAWRRRRGRRRSSRTASPTIRRGRGCCCACRRATCSTCCTGCALGDSSGWSTSTTTSDASSSRASAASRGICTSLSSRASEASRGICTSCFSGRARRARRTASVSRPAGSFTRRARRHAPSRPPPPRPAEDADSGAVISTPDDQNNLGLWMDRNGAAGAGSRPAK